MKKIAFWAITKGGKETAIKLSKQWKRHYPETEITYFFPETFADKLKDKIAAEFSRWDAHVFIMATGIVIRCIAPNLRSKYEDPAVIVGDEKGSYLISLLSGHWGNANWLTKELAKFSNSTAIITTSTDVQGILAVEELIRRWNSKPENPHLVKKLNTILANSGTLKIYWDIKTILKKPIFLPERYEFTTTISTADIIISNKIFPQALMDSKLVLRIPYFTLGVGCRKNVPFSLLWNNFKEFINTHQLSIKSLKSISSISIKRFEPALAELSRTLNLPLQFYDEKELGQFVSEINHSSFVKKITGVGSVCEPAAMRDCLKPHLIIPKTIFPQTTFAIAADISMLSGLDQEV